MTTSTMSVARIAAMLAAAACGSDSDDVVGPFTGTPHRFVVDRLVVPRDTVAAQLYAGDLDGNGVVENKLGSVTAALSAIEDLSRHGEDMIAAGAIASIVEIQADDLLDDGSVGVTYYGADGDAAIVAGGRFVAGAFRSNPAATTRHPGRAVVRLPIYTNADPLAIELDGVEIELSPDGNGGYDAIVRGGVREAAAREVAYAGLEQMMRTEPLRHLVFRRSVDADADGTLSPSELEQSIIALLVSADVRLFDGDAYAPGPSGTPDSISLGFGAHLSPCPDGNCALDPAAIDEPCRDRVRDGNETDVDCGGACEPCWDGSACLAPSDCQSNACADGRCGAASCTDGVRDGFESDLDCGDTCGPCETGASCAADRDCTSGQCSNGSAVVGRCEG